MQNLGRELIFLDVPLEGEQRELECAVVPERELIDDFRSFDGGRADESVELCLDGNHRSTPEEHVLEWDLVPNLLPQILICVQVVSEGKEKWIVRC